MPGLTIVFHPVFVEVVKDVTVNLGEPAGQLLGAHIVHLHRWRP